MNPETITIGDNNMSVTATFTSTSAIDAQAENSLVVFPTVIDDVFYIQFKDEPLLDVTIQLISVSRKIVYSERATISGKTVEIHPGSLSKRFYFCKVRPGDTITTQKLIKQ